MKDRYLFRGKRIDNGDWVEGYLFEDITKARHQSYITQGGFVPALSMPSDRFVEVDPETVGMCTGLTDIDDKLIWEGDIILMSDNYKVNNHKDVVKYVPSDRFSCYPALQYRDGYFYKVIGTIHDRKEQDDTNN